MKAEYLVVDSGGFIKNAPLRDLASNIITLNDVVSEIRDKDTRQRLQVLPYELEMRQPSQEGFKRVAEFAKKTGDYAVLSATDLSVLAVTYDLEALHVGTSHLRTEPVVKKTTVFYQPEKDKEKILKKDAKIAGFYLNNGDDEYKENFEESNEFTTDPSEENSDFSSLNFWKDPMPEIEDTELLHGDHLNSEQLSQLNNFLLSRSFISGFDFTTIDFIIKNMIDESDPYLPTNVKRWLDNLNLSTEEIEYECAINEDHLWYFISNDLDFAYEDIIPGNDDTEEKEDIEIDDEAEEDGGYSSNAEEDDDSGWITPGNLKNKKKEFRGSSQPVEEKKVVVACMTTDFAMQNVLKGLGLNILGTNGMVIKTTKNWILRCYGCFYTTPVMSKVFCPRCGNKTLKRVSVTVNSDGSQQIHISTRRPISKRGKKFSLPAPKGGKHAVNPRLFEDQRDAQQRISAKALARTNPMGEDYMAGSSPFVTKDVTSKSAMLGLHGSGKGNAQVPGMYWARKNPNQVKKNTGNGKKK